MFKAARHWMWENGEGANHNYMYIYICACIYVCSFNPGHQTMQTEIDACKCHSYTYPLRDTYTKMFVHVHVATSFTAPCVHILHVWHLHASFLQPTWIQKSCAFCRNHSSLWQNTYGTMCEPSPNMSVCWYLSSHVSTLMSHTASKFPKPNTQKQVLFPAHEHVHVPEAFWKLKPVSSCQQWGPSLVQSHLPYPAAQWRIPDHLGMHPLESTR